MKKIIIFGAGPTGKLLPLSLFFDTYLRGLSPFYLIINNFAMLVNAFTSKKTVVFLFPL